MEKGISIYMIVVLLFVLFGLAVGLSSLVLGQLTILKSMGNSITAFYAADSGAEEALYKIKQAGTDGGPDVSINEKGFAAQGDIENSFFEALLLCHNNLFGSDTLCEQRCPLCGTDSELGSPVCIPRYCITSKGTFDGTNRAIEVKY